MVTYYVVDAFADQLFGGNPAGVCVLDRRGGTLWCAVSGETVKISGRAALYLRGQLCV